MNKNFNSSFNWYLSVAIFALFFSAGLAHAAPLTYSSDAYISITSPAVILTIASGSVADALVANTTNTVVTMSSGTGGSFTITATSSDLTVSASAGGGIASVTCAAGNVATVLITQSTGSSDYIITPTGAQCISAPAAEPSHGGQTLADLYPGSSSGGGGGASSPSIPASPSVTIVPTVASVSTSPTDASLRVQLQALLKQLADLKRRAGLIKTIFTRAFVLGEADEAIRSLQVFLNTNGFLISQSGAGSAGNETNKYGLLTRKALCRFQVSKGIVNKATDTACGIFGPRTRALINKLIQ